MSRVKNKLLISIGLTSIFLASNSNAQMDMNSMENEKANNEVKTSEINPFVNLSSKIEDDVLKTKEKERELDLLDTEIEMQRRKFQQDILPYQMEIQKLQLQQELRNIQDQINQARIENERKNSVPDVTIEDIRNRIDSVAADMLEKQQRKIEKLEKEKDENIKRQNMFNLKLISYNNNELYAVISNKNGEEFNIMVDDVVNGWKVEGIDNIRNKVMLRKKGQLEVVEFDSNISKISVPKILIENEENGTDNSEDSMNENAEWDESYAIPRRPNNR